MHTTTQAYIQTSNLEMDPGSTEGGHILAVPRSKEAGMSNINASCEFALDTEKRDSGRILRGTLELQAENEWALMRVTTRQSRFPV